MRAYEPCYVIGSGVSLPPDHDRIGDAVARRGLTEVEADRLGVAEVAVADHSRSAPQMAVTAADTMLTESGWDPDDVGFLAHAHAYYQGHDFWSPAHYIADRVRAHECIPVNISQMCNGGAAALMLAMQFVGVNGRSAVVTTADKFSSPGFDRWSGDYDTVYGDGATSLLLTTDDGGEDPVLRVDSLVMRAAPEFEAMYRGNDDFADMPHQYRSTIDIKATKKAFVKTAGGTGHFHDIATKVIGQIVTESLASAGLRPRDITATMLPRLSDKVLSLMYVEAINTELGDTIGCLRQRTGHLGAGDFSANIDYLRRSDTLAVGEHALVLGGGGGFTWSSAVVTRVR